MSLTQPTGKRESERGRTKSLQESLEKHTTIQVASTASSTMLDIKDYSPPLMTTAQRISRRLWNFGNGASQAILMNACHCLSVLKLPFRKEANQNQPTPSGEGHEDQCHWSFLNAEVCVQGDDRPAAWLWHWPRRIEIKLHRFA